MKLKRNVFLYKKLLELSKEANLENHYLEEDHIAMPRGTMSKIL